MRILWGSFSPELFWLKCRFQGDGSRRGGPRGSRGGRGNDITRCGGALQRNLLSVFLSYFCQSSTHMKALCNLISIPHTLEIRFIISLFQEKLACVFFFNSGKQRAARALIPTEAWERRRCYHQKSKGVLFIYYLWDGEVLVGLTTLDFWQNKRLRKTCRWAVDLCGTWCKVWSGLTLHTCVTNERQITQTQLCQVTCETRCWPD